MIKYDISSATKSSFRSNTQFTVQLATVIILSSGVSKRTRLNPSNATLGWMNFYFGKSTARKILTYERAKIW